MKQGCIYRFTNTVNNKKYIGQSCDFERRMKEHAGKKRNVPISQAIQNYGWEAFKREIVVDGIPAENLEDLEIFYIEAENSMVPRGYNVKKNNWGTFYFDRQQRKWQVRDRNKKHIGHYFTKEKANEALKLYKSTGERMKSDVHKRRMGTGSIQKRGKRYRAQIYMNKKFKSKTFDTVEQCEAWFKSRSNN